MGFEHPRVIGVAPFARLVTDLHRIDELAFCLIGPNSPGERFAIGSRVGVDIFPVCLFNGFKHQANINDFHLSQTTNRKPGSNPRRPRESGNRR